MMMLQNVLDVDSTDPPEIDRTYNPKLKSKLPKKEWNLLCDKIDERFDTMAKQMLSLIWTTWTLVVAEFMIIAMSIIWHNLPLVILRIVIAMTLPIIIAMNLMYAIPWLLYKKIKDIERICTDENKARQDDGVEIRFLSSINNEHMEWSVDVSFSDPILPPEDV